MRDLAISAEGIAQTTLVDKTFEKTKTQIARVLSQLEAGKKVLQDCERYTTYLSSELDLKVRFDEAKAEEIAGDEDRFVRLAHHFASGRIVSRGIKKILSRWVYQL